MGIITAKKQAGRGEVDFSTWGFADDPIGKFAAKQAARAIRGDLREFGLSISIGYDAKGERRGDPLRITVQLPLGGDESSGPSFAFSLNDLASAEFFDLLADFEEVEFARDLATALRSLADRMDKRLAKAPAKYGLCRDSLLNHQIPIGSRTCLSCGFTAADTAAAPAPAPRSPSPDG